MTDSRLLIVGPSWVGDMVMAQSLFKKIKERQPDGTIDVVAPAWSLPVIERMPEVRSGIVLDVGHGELGFSKRRRLGIELRSSEYDRAIVLPRSLKAALVPWFARIPIRTGFRGETRIGLINDTRLFDRHRLNQTVKRFVALGLSNGTVPERVPYPELTVQPERRHDVIARLGLATDRPVVALMPGAEYGPAKRWPQQHFAALARLLRDAGYAIWVLGSAKDRPAADDIAENATVENICGETSLADAIDLLAACDHAVTNDSGLLHIAAAVGTHVHALYGSSDPGFTPPLTNRCTVHSLRLSCSPCFQRECPLGHLNCLTQLSPENVFGGIQAAPSGG